MQFTLALCRRNGRNKTGVFKMRDEKNLIEVEIEELEPKTAPQSDTSYLDLR